jgi:hypothetical protein
MVGHAHLHEAAEPDLCYLGWGLTLLSPENQCYASTCQIVGVNTGYLISETGAGGGGPGGGLSGTVGHDSAIIELAWLENLVQRFVAN